MINATLNWSFEPCNDFYNFVCSRFEGGKGVLDKINDYTQQAVREMLVNIVIPSSHQKATEKAAGLFRACTRLGSDSTYSEVPSLKRFLSRLGLDLSNMPYDPEFDILDRVTSLSFEFGLPIFVKFGMFKSPPEIQDYILEMRINIEDENWLRLKHQELSDTDLEGLYLDYLRDYDQSILDSRISQRIIASELIMRKFLYDLRLKKIFALTRTTVEMLGTLTEGSISKDQWVWVVQKYTSKILNATDPVLLWDNAPAVVGLLMDSKQMSRHDARILLGWTLVRRLLPLAHGTWFTKASKEWGGGEGYTYDFCYEIISSVMALALTQRYLNTFVPRNAVESARSVLTNVMDTMVNKIGNTSWIEDPVKTILLWKARDMALLTAYPDEYANETMVEKFYERFPDVDAEFFSPYVASRRLLTIRIFRRHANAILRPATPNALYGFQENIIKVYAGILQPPVYIEGAPAAINYGGLGQVAGHEMMHAYDVKGIALDQKGRPLDNLKPTASMRAYEEKVLCLRASYERAEPHSRARTTDHWIDSEGFADYTGLLLAHSAFQRLSVTEREEALPGILLTAQQLFFVAHCAKWCAPPSESPRRHPEQSYWPSRSRCIVPLQNMPEFADAYQCKPGDPLNPEERCSFW
ncbi:neprilysin-1-like [Amblyomma americanum]